MKYNNRNEFNILEDIKVMFGYLRKGSVIHYDPKLELYVGRVHPTQHRWTLSNSSIEKYLEEKKIS